ncbi:hypothetical protein LUQ84_003175 [Hamiltosporidium tvaerminnensis]|nr:hypothetical protein LUQ84_003175 [Hamiltosporidium tvaerminnensis]
MKQKFTFLDISTIVNELSETLPTQYITNVHSSKTKTFYISLSSKKILLIQPGTRIHLSDERDQEINHFTVVLRKHLRRKKIRSVVQHTHDRVIIIECYDNKSVIFVVIEMFSQGNILLLDTENTIIALYRIVRDMNVKRGEKYSFNDVSMTYTYEMYKRLGKKDFLSFDKILSEYILKNSESGETNNNLENKQSEENKINIENENIKKTDENNKIKKIDENIKKTDENNKIIENKNIIESKKCNKSKENESKNIELDVTPLTDSNGDKVVNPCPPSFFNNSKFFTSFFTDLLKKITSLKNKGYIYLKNNKPDSFLPVLIPTLPHISFDSYNTAIDCFFKVSLNKNIKIKELENLEKLKNLSINTLPSQNIELGKLEKVGKIGKRR